MKIFLFLLPFLLCLGLSCEKKKDFVLDEIDLVPEGIAYSEKDKLLYVTSIAKSKIITVSSTGQQKDFVTQADGYIPGVGIWVDDEKGQVLALGGYFMREKTESALFVFDVRSRKLIRKHSIEDGERHFMNDLVLTRTGDIYVTDTESSSIYVLKNGQRSFELFTRSSDIDFPNGIAVSDNDRKLYVASYSKGVRVIDIATKRILNQEDSLSLSHGIDGLEFYKGNLFAIQNGVQKNGDNFRKLLLNKTGDAIVGVEVIDANNAALNLPLTFCVADGNAVVIGNSNLQFLNQVTFKITAVDSLKKTRLLTYELDRR